MSIGFGVKTVEEIRAELANMSDTQLIEHRKTIRSFCCRLPGLAEAVERGRGRVETQAPAQDSSLRR
jgi:hypothetical protein